MICPYCNVEMKFSKASDFYGTRSYKNNIYHCDSCDARVGTHGRGNTPLGTPANANLRALRRKCHDLFDPMWKRKGYSRGGAYKWLQREMELSPEEAHIGKFNEEQCKKLMRKFGKRIR